LNLKRGTREFTVRWNAAPVRLRLVGADWNIQKLHYRHWGRVAGPKAHLQDTQVTAGPILESRSEFGEQFDDSGIVAQARKRQPPP
jgi:hypothetical protein